MIERAEEDGGGGGGDGGWVRCKQHIKHIFPLSTAAV